MKITHLNPDTLMKSPAYSQAVSVDGAGRLLFVGGQNGTRPDGTMAGADIGAQSAQALLNVQEALKAGGAGWADVVKLTIFLVHGQDLQAAFAAAQTAVPGMTPTAVSGLFVAGLGNPKALIEIEAVAALASPT